MTAVEHHTADELHSLHGPANCPRPAKRLWRVRQARLGPIEPEITELSGASRRSAQGWVRRYDLGGIEGFRERSGRGRKPFRTAE